MLRQRTELSGSGRSTTGLSAPREGFRPASLAIHTRRGWLATVQIDTTPAPPGRAGKPALQAVPAGCSTTRPVAGGTPTRVATSSLSVAVVDPYTVARTALPLLLS